MELEQPQPGSGTMELQQSHAGFWAAATILPWPTPHILCKAKGGEQTVVFPIAVPKGAASGDNISTESQPSSPHTNYFPEANGKERQREKQVLTVCCRSSKKKWTKLKELQLFVCI